MWKQLVNFLFLRTRNCNTPEKSEPIRNEGITYSEFQTPNYKNAFHFLQQKLTFNVGRGRTLTCSLCVWAEEDLGPQKVIRTRSRAQLEGGESLGNPERCRQTRQSWSWLRWSLLYSPTLMKSLIKLQTQENAVSTIFPVEMGKG